MSIYEFSLPPLYAGIVLLLVRIILSVTFFSEALTKFKDIRKFSKNDGIPVPVAYGIAIAELCAALGMLSGVLAQWAGVGLLILMSITLCLHIFKWHSPYWAAKRGWEYDLLMFTLAAVVVVMGTGPFTLL